MNETVPTVKRESWKPPLASLKDGVEGWLRKQLDFKCISPDQKNSDAKITGYKISVVNSVDHVANIDHDTNLHSHSSENHEYILHSRESEQERYTVVDSRIGS